MLMLSYLSLLFINNRVAQIIETVRMIGAVEVKNIFFFKKIIITTYYIYPRTFGLNGEISN